MRHFAPSFTLLTLTLMLSGPLAGAETPVSRDTFALTKGDTLQIDWRGTPLVRNDYISAIGPDALKKTENSRDDAIDSWKVNNLWQLDDSERKVTYRREVASNGREVELTTEFRVPSYYIFPYEKLNSYSFTIPISAVEGMTFQANAIRNKKSRGSKGKITATMPDGPIIDSTISFIAFEAVNRPGLIIDLRPTGVTSFNSYGPSVLQGIWTIVKEGQFLRFSFNGRAATQNGVFASKARIIEGTAEDYYRLHPVDSYHYYSTIPALYNLAFGSGEPAAKWQAVGLQRHTAERGFGWLDTDGITLEGDSSRGVLQGRAQGSGTHRLLLNVPQPGIYILTARICADQTPIGPFKLECNAAPVAEDIEVAPGEIKTITFSTYARGNTVELDWSGTWAISSLGVQTLIYEWEDQSFKRGVWLASDLPAPTTLHQFKPAMPSPRGAIETTPYRSHPDDATVRQASLPPVEVLKGGDTPGMDWRWFGSIGSLGPGNYGSFHEFQTDEKIERRLDELKAQGYQVLILNGLHFRIAWIEQYERVQKTIARITELAHQRGMKIVEHHSTTVIPHQATAFNKMLGNLDQTLREVDTGLVTRGFCLNNPTFRENLLSDVTSWVSKTKSDGIMLDELSFHTGDFCGCTHCREQFHKETGVWLPTDETDPALRDKKSRLWVLWQKWRNRALGDWSLELIRRIQKENPDFLLMKYTTHYGATSDYITGGQGGGLYEDARSSNFLGCEIMSRNVYATHRSNLAFRSIFNSFRERFQIPIFSLVYPNDQPLFAYAGWAMNNMRGQATWSIIGADKLANDAPYLNWKDNMSIRDARPLSDVAVVFSSSSRDFARYFNHSSDLVGTCEELDDLHIPYDVILNDSLKPDVLSRYQLLVLPSVCSMSDDEIHAVHGYLQKGGSVLTMGHTAVLDESGGDRDSWPIGEWLGLSWGRDTIRGPFTLEGEFIGSSNLAFPNPIPKVLPGKTTEKSQVLAECLIGNARSVGFAEGKIGKGTLFFSAPRLGAANYEPEVRTGSTSDFEYNPTLAKLFSKVLKRLQPGEARFEPVLIPREVRTSFYEQNTNGQTIRFVHLYNATGATLPPGSRIPGKPSGDPFPKLASDIVFDITLGKDGPVAADIVSPDFPEAHPVKLRDLGNGRYRITISKDDLKVYSIVRLKNGSSRQAATAQ